VNKRTPAGWTGREQREEAHTAPHFPGRMPPLPPLHSRHASQNLGVNSLERQIIIARKLPKD